ncbi:MAG: radical SAM protein, partial [Elusimicrobia bacterium]|nr:radical SAM protein [Elusimicrobiota bacterium]
MSRSISFYTVGCRLNQSETALLESLCREAGFTVVGPLTPADIFVANSCTVTSRGDSDTRRAVLRAVRLNPKVRVAVIGCQAQVQREELLSWPNVRWVIGTEKKMSLLDILREGEEGLLAPAVLRRPFVLPISVSSGARVRAHLKIQDGCDNSCAYCEIPFARGPSRSRQFDNLMREAKALVQAGHREIVITGVNIGDYSHEGRG